MIVPGIPFDQCNYRGRRISPIGGVLHRTYGRWPGDYSVGKNNPSLTGFHFLIGKDEGQWVQFNDTSQHCNHAPGANSSCVGIEFTGTNEQPLTDWQVKAGAFVIATVSNAHGIPLNYYDGGRRTPTPGWTNHASVLGSDHSDRITTDDWNRMAALAGGMISFPPPPAPPANVDMAAIRKLAAAKLLNDGLGDLPTLRQGTSGRSVVLWQEAMNLIANRGLRVDGSFGVATHSATSDFQRICGLEVDGIVGPKTKWWAVTIVQNIRDGKA